MKFLTIENHPNDSRVKIKDDEICQTLSSRMGTGGGNVPMVLGIDAYNQTTQLEVISPLRSAEGGDTKPMVMVIEDELQEDQKSAVVEDETEDADGEEVF